MITTFLQSMAAAMDQGLVQSDSIKEKDLLIADHNLGACKAAQEKEG